MKGKTIFICYSSKDRDICDIYNETLSSLGYKVYTGVSIKIGELYEEALKTMIQECDLVLVVLTDNFIGSTWSKDVINVFMLSTHREKILIANHSNKTIPSYLSIYPCRDFVISNTKEIEDYFKVFGESQHILENFDYTNKYIDVFKNNVNRPITVVCGAGVSYAPQWDDIINNMFEKHLKKFGFSDVEIEDFVNTLPHSSIIKAQYLKILLGKEYIPKLKEEIYSIRNDENKTPKAIAKYIENNYKVNSVITYNFDTYLEREIIYTHDIPVYHVHGKISMEETEEPYSTVFSEDAYHTQYIEPYNKSNIIQVANFINNTCVFIGVSFNDPNLRRLLDVCRRKENDNTFQHVAIMKKSTNINADFIFAKNLASFGIYVIYIDDFDEIPDILTNIKQENLRFINS